MNTFRPVKLFLPALLCVAVLLSPSPSHAQPQPVVTATVIAVSGSVEIQRTGEKQWQTASTNQALRIGDKLKTGDPGRATIRLSNFCVERLSESSVVEVVTNRLGDAVVRLLEGKAFIKNREQPGETKIETPLVSGAIRGTELVLTVAASGETTLALIEGEVALKAGENEMLVKSGEQVVVKPGEAARKSALINAINTVQWCLYYPAILDLRDIELSSNEKSALSASLQAYKEGNLPLALAAYPSGRNPNSDAEKIYRAALVLSGGQVDHCEKILDSLSTSTSAASALRRLIAAVKFQSLESDVQPSTATEWMGESYYRQSRSDLKGALSAARLAMAESVDFGFAWARVGELEFSFGRSADADAAVHKALEISPSNAQALALKGFVDSSRGHLNEAQDAFNRAIEIDSAFGSAWVGRGLIGIRRGQTEAGMQDLQTAAALEPQRSVLRSYLGKAFHRIGRNDLAIKELNYAQEVDPNDPTPFLYSALLNQQENRINQSIADLEKSQDLNDNRSVFRSKLLLDQDRSVRSANLASIYKDAGMTDVSVRESSRAVQDDYANHSAHLFLANSYEALRDPHVFNFRYETPAYTEFLMSSLLAPVNGHSLSRYVSEQEYSPLFESGRAGVISRTDYSSQGDWRQIGSQYGYTDRIGYSLDALYQTVNGSRPNNDLEQLQLSAQVKLELTPLDSVYLQVSRSETENGDLSQLYNQTNFLASYRSKELQEPNVIGGYHREWSPGIHTLFLAARLTDTFSTTNPANATLFLGRLVSGEVFAVSRPGATTSTPTFPLDYRNESELYTMELQQIFQLEKHTSIFGGKYQTGTFDTDTKLGQSTPSVIGTPTQVFPPLLPFLFTSPATNQSVSSDLERTSLYGYHFWHPIETLTLQGGIAYDRIRFPENHRVAPVSSREETTERVSPKAGFIWTPTDDTTLRGAYTRSLGGLSYDQSVRLEPVLVGGFNQAYRSLISESVAGSMAAPRFETYSLGLDHQFKSRTYVGVETELLRSKASRVIGLFNISDNFPFTTSASSTRQNLDYEEKTLLVTVNQLVGDELSLGARYRLTDAELESTFPEIPLTVSPSARSTLEATLHQCTLFALFNHPCGFFAGANSIFTTQSNRGYAPDIPGDAFWQFNISAGYRFWQRRAEAQVALLNITDQDYQLNPLTLYSELPHDRTLALSLRLNF